MSRKRIPVAVVLLAGALTGSALGGTTDSHTVAITLQEIAELACSGSPSTLVLSNVSTTPGSLPAPVTDATTSLSWTSSVASGMTRKITASLDSNYPAGIVLKATLAKPAGSNGTSSGQKTLSDTTQDMFTGIAGEPCTGATITFEASLASIVAPVSSESKILTWTLTAEQ